MKKAVRCLVQFTARKASLTMSPSATPLADHLLTPQNCGAHHHRLSAHTDQVHQIHGSGLPGTESCTLPGFCMLYRLPVVLDGHRP